MLIRSLVLLALLACALPASAQPDPPGRVGSLSATEGAVVVAPAGETEWRPAPVNRPLTPGDRLWTDPGAHADVHLAAAMLHIRSETFLEMPLLDESVLQSVLREGVLQARVRSLAAGELFEIDTPQLAFRALQPGTYRIDADPARRITRVTVRDGAASVSGRSGRTLTLYPGQQLEVAGTDLDQVASVSFADDDFDRWAAERNARDDQSISARFVPEVVGSVQLDAHGSWAQDVSYGLVWYPGAVTADWAPYRYGRWQWIKPWGWTWIDNAPWGFAPFHYGRWALIGSRWAWVPGRLGPRPVYAPALVAFVGGGAMRPLVLGTAEAIAWYPLAPGETWQPFFATSPAYLRRVNQSAGASARVEPHVHLARMEGVTAVRIEDFRSGEPVQRHWGRPHPADLARAQPLSPPPVAAPRAALPEGTVTVPGSVAADRRPSAIASPSPWPRARVVGDVRPSQRAVAHASEAGKRPRKRAHIRHERPTVQARATQAPPPGRAVHDRDEAAHRKPQQKGPSRAQRP